MPDNADIADELARLNEANRYNSYLKPFAVAWYLKDGTPLARMIPDLVTRFGARQFLEEEKGVDTGEDQWCIVSRQDGEIKPAGTGDPKLVAMAVAVFTAKENLVPC